LEAAEPDRGLALPPDQPRPHADAASARLPLENQQAKGRNAELGASVPPRHLEFALAAHELHG
jgi:hypothetical protein